MFNSRVRLEDREADEEAMDTTTTTSTALTLTSFAATTIAAATTAAEEESMATEEVPMADITSSSASTATNTHANTSMTNTTASATTSSTSTSTTTATTTTTTSSSAAQEQQAALVANNQDLSRQDPPRLMQFVGDFELFHAKLLGRGAFSNVCEALNRQTNDVVAVKALCLRDVAANQNELKINRIVQGHPGVVSLLNHTVLHDVSYLFFELCAGGELFHQITPYVGLQRREMIGSYYAQLVDAVEFVHERGIAHLDIKAENIFIDESGSFVKLGDFGLSALVEDGPVFGCRGSLSYAAPENLYSSKSRAERVLLTGHSYGYDGVKADMWSCGVLLYVMMYGCTPWEAAKESNADFRVYRSTFGCPNVQPWSRMPTTFKTLFQRLLNITPNRRWSAQNLKEYIARSFGWKAVHRPLA